MERPSKKRQIGEVASDSASMEAVRDNDAADPALPPLTFLEFYAGVGGWHMALQLALQGERRGNFSQELQCVAALDHSDLCSKAYLHNFSTLNDSSSAIEKLSVKQVEEWNAKVWAMSPPCQPHTRQHDNQTRDLSDPRSQSFLHLCELLEAMNTDKLPSLILLENVVGFEASNSCQRWQQALATRNYLVSHFHINPTQVGIPNDRPRHYSVAVLLDKQSATKESMDLQQQYFEEPKSYHSDKSCDGDSKENLEVRIHKSLQEFGIFPTAEVSFKNLPPISEFLDNDKKDIHAGNCATLLVPGKIISSKSSWCFDIVTPKDHRTACFTRSYGRYIKGTGSLLYMGSKSSSIVFLPPEEREYDENWTKGIDDLDASLRYFSGSEMARLLDFAPNFTFPTDYTLKQQWKLVGNSLNVRVASRMAELGLRLIAKK